MSSGPRRATTRGVLMRPLPRERIGERARTVAAERWCANGAAARGAAAEPRDAASTSAVARRSRALAQQLPRPREHGAPHGACELAGLRVLPARMVAGEEHDAVRHPRL